MREVIDQYIVDHKYAWAETSQKSERARLNTVSTWLILGHSPEEIYQKASVTMKPYAITTLFIRLSHFYGWLIERGLRTGPNIFKDFKRKNALLFKGAYKREEINISYEEAFQLISTIKNETDRNFAFCLLRSGCRVSELQTLNNGRVQAKGKKVRRVFGLAHQSSGSLYNDIQSLRKSLRSVGLKPHTLRKLFATALAQRGAGPEDLCQVMGWNSIETAYLYLQPKKDDELNKLVQDATRT